MYIPSQEILEKYAHLLVRFALNEWKGVSPGDVIYIQIPECAKPLYIPLQKAVLQAGAIPLFQYLADGVDRSFYEYASDEALTYYPKEYMLSRVATMDHRLFILASDNKHELESIAPEKIFARSRWMKFYRDALEEKENQGKYTRCLAMYGTAAMAQEAGCSLEEYRQQIIEACYLDTEDPIAERKAVRGKLKKVQTYLSELPIESVHVLWPDVDLHVRIGEKRKRLAGSGRNIPSFEAFVSPDRRWTNGRIRFNQPLYRHGVLIKDIELHFTDWKVTKASASNNLETLEKMIAQENADKVGEFSLTDKRFSRITRFMAETLFDENVGGPFGNCHIALGNAYKDSYAGDPATLSEEERTDLGFNQSVIHTDIISTTNRIVTATLRDGTEHILYKDGMFTFLE